MESQCVVKLPLFYPKHHFDPVDLLNFVESTEFTREWDKLGLDAENDLTSLQLCIMAKPWGDMAIDGTGGLLLSHRHHFGDASDKPPVTVYYAYFEDHGCAYLNYVDIHHSVEFSEDETEAIRISLARVLNYLDRLRSSRNELSEGNKNGTT